MPPPLSLLSICQHPPPQEEDTPGRPYPGERTHTPAPSSDSPQTLDRGRYRLGGRGRRGGGACPLPCLYFQYASIPHPHTSSLFRLAPDTGPWGVSPLGEGQTGRGRMPPPLSLLPICQHPPPQEEDTPGRPYPGERTHTPAPSSDSPQTLDRGRYRPWGRGRRGGGACPLPCLYFQYASIPHPHTSSLFRLAPDTGPWEVSPRGEGQTGRGRMPPPLSLYFQYASIPHPRQSGTRKVTKGAERGRRTPLNGR
jgi:hypothetical protein